MTNRKEPFVVGEWYHCNNNSIDKRAAFEDPRDYYRFLELLYLANDEFPVRRGEIGPRKFDEVLIVPRGKKIVAIGAFSLMPDRFDLVLKEVTEGGISAFMRKLGTAYTMYFNSRHDRAGNLFRKPFQSRHVSEGRYQHLINYVHCTPAALYEPGWRSGNVVDPQFIKERIEGYQYSSIGAHTGRHTPFSAILDAEAFAGVRALSIQKMLQEARQYYIDSGLL